MATGILISFVLALLVALGIAMLLRNRCSIVVRALLGGLIGIVCFFVFSVASTVIYFARNYEPPETFNPGTYQGQTGQISVPFKGDVTVHLQSEKDAGTFKMLDINGRDGVAAAPVGNYHVMGYGITSTGQDGSAVSISAWFRSKSRAPVIAVQPNTTVQIAGGPPLTASISVKQVGKDRVNMDLAVVGSAGESCTVSGSDGKEPGFQVLSESGEVLMQGNFEYG